MSDKSTCLVFTGSQETLEKALLERLSSPGTRPFSPIPVLTGSNLASLYLRRKLAEITGAFGNIKFLTLRDLAELLLRKDPSWYGKPPLPASTGYRLAVRAARDMESGSPYSPIADSPGFPRVLEGAVGEMRRITMGSAIPLPESQGFPEQARTLVKTHNAVTEVFNAFRDGISLIRAASDNAPDFIDISGSDTLYIYGLHDPAPVQRKLIEALSEHINMECYLTWSARAAHTDPHKVLPWLLDLGYTHVMLDPLGDLSYSGNTDLEGLQRRALSDPTGSHTGISVSPDGSFAILACPGRTRECLELARECTRLAKSGIPFRNMAILLRNPNEYRKVLTDAFIGIGIPLYMPGAVIAADMPYPRAVSMLLNLWGGGYTRRDVCEFLEEAPLKNTSGKSGQWSRLAHMAGIIGTREQWLQGIGRIARSGSKPDRTSHGDPEDASGLLALLGVLFDTLEGLPVKATWPEHCHSVRTMCENLLRPVEGYDECMEVIESLASLDAIEGIVGLADFRTSLNLELKGRSQDVGHYEMGGVNVLSISAASGLTFDAVLIPGLLEKGFPSASRGNPLLTEDIRRALEELAHLPLSQGNGNLQDEEFDLFSTAICASRRALILTYPTMEGQTGRELAPSPFLLWAASVLAGKQVTSETLDSITVPQFSRLRLSCLSSDSFDSCLSHRESDLWVMEHHPGLAKEYAEAAIPGLGPSLRGDARRWTSPFLSEWDGSVLTEDTRNFLAGHSPTLKAMSPTAMEDFCGCPFRGYLGHILRVETLEEPETPWNMENSERGTVVHSILEGFFQRANVGDWCKDPREGEDILSGTLREIATPILDYQGKAGRNTYGLIWDYERKVILSNTEAYLRKELNAPQGAFPFTLPEEVLLEFPFGSADAPIGIKVSQDKTILLKGRADRIDVHENGRVVVVDYKTGRSKGKDGRLCGGEHLQLPLYSIAAGSILKDRTEVANITAEYHYMMQGSSGGTKISFTHSHLCGRQGDLLSILAWLDETVTTGKFLQFPGKDKENCIYCPYIRVCGVNIDLIMGQKSGSPELQTFMNIRSIE